MAGDQDATETRSDAADRGGLMAGEFTRSELIKRADWGTRTRCVGLAILVLLCAVVLGGVFVALGTALFEAVSITEPENPVVYHASTTVLNFVGFVAAGGAYLAYRGDWSLVTVRSPTRRDAIWTAAGTVLFFIVMALGSAVISILDLETAENVAIQRGQENPELFLLFLPIQFLVTAPAEEFLFRGVIQGLFRRAYGILPGVILAAVLFGLIHYPALAGTSGVVPVMTMLIATGALLGFLYEYTGNLFVPIVIHAIWNVFVFGNEYLSAVGAV